MKQNRLWHGNQKSYPEQIKSIVVIVMSSITQWNYVKNYLCLKFTILPLKKNENRFLCSIFKYRLDILAYFIGHEIS